MRPNLLHNLWHAVGLQFWDVIFRVLNQIEVVGAENRPQPGERGILILSNHVSAIDPFAIAATSMPFFSKVWWRAAAKVELFSIPIVKQILNSWGAIPVRRGTGDLQVIQRMVSLLPDCIMVAFPEGKRSVRGTLLPGRAGMGKVIYDARPKVIPIYLQGTDTLLPKGKILPLIGQTVRVYYGPPVDCSRFYAMPDSPAVSQKIVDEVMRAIGRLKDQAVTRTDPREGLSGSSSV